MRVLVVLIAIIVFGVLGFNFLGIEAMLRHACSRIEANTGVLVDFADASGNVLAGEARVTGLSLNRDAGDEPVLDVRAAEVRLEASVIELGRHPVPFGLVDVSGLEGRFVRSPPVAGEAPARLTRELVAEVLRVRESRIESSGFDARGERKVTLLEIDTLEIEGYRSDWTLHDFLFRSNFEGTLDGASFVIERTVEDGTVLVTWRIRGLPKKDWSEEAGAGAAAASVLGGGRKVDLDVIHSWPLVAPETIHMDWTIRTSQQTLEFEFDVHRDGFQGARGMRETGVMKRVGAGIVDAVGDKIQDVAAELQDRFRGFLRRR